MDIFYICTRYIASGLADQLISDGALRSSVAEIDIFQEVTVLKSFNILNVCSTICVGSQR